MKKPRSRVPKLEPEKAAATKLPKGRYARVWLSPEFLAFAKLHEQEPPELAAACAHTFGMKNPARLVLLENVSKGEFEEFRRRLEQ